MTDSHDVNRPPSDESSSTHSAADGPLAYFIDTAAQAGRRLLELLAQAKLALFLVTLVLVLLAVALFIAVIVLLLQL